MSFVPPEPPIQPDDPTPPPTLNVPLPPPEVGFGSPWAPADAENRDRILDWWRMWFRRVLFPWVTAWSEYWVAQWARIVTYLNTWLSYAGEYIEEHAVAGYSWRFTDTPFDDSGTTTVEIAPYDPLRPLLVGDLVNDTSDMTLYGVIVEVIDNTHAVVDTLGSLRGIEGHSWYTTATTIAPTGTTAVVLAPDVDPHRYPQVGDLVSDQSASIRYGQVTVVTDATHVTVAPLGVLRGPQGDPGEPGADGAPGVVQELVAGSNITIDSTDPAAPVISASGSGFGVVESIVAGGHITVDDTDPANPVVSSGGFVESIVAGSNITIDDTDPANPIVNATGGGGGGGVVESIVAGPRITVDSTDPANPIVGTNNGIPLNVFPTVSRPPALVNGDAYFDSTLLIPVWSYGGVWRDSEGNPVDGPPTIIIDDVDNDGGSYGGIVGSEPITDWSGPFGAFDNLTAVVYDGKLYSAPYGQEATNRLLVSFAGTAAGAAFITAPGSITLRAWTRTAGLWVEGGLLHAIVTTADSEGDVDNANTFHLTYDGSAWALLDTTTAIDNGYFSIAMPSSAGGYFLYGAVPLGSSGWHFTSDLEFDPPEILSPPAVGLDSQAFGLGTLYGWDDTSDAVAKFTGDSFDAYETSPAGWSFAALDGVRGGDGLNLSMIAHDGSGNIRHYTALNTHPAFTSGPFWVRNGVGLAVGDRLWVCDPIDPFGDHVSFTVRVNGEIGTSSFAIYLDGYVYTVAGASGYDYLLKIAASV